MIKRSDKEWKEKMRKRKMIHTITLVARSIAIGIVIVLCIKLFFLEEIQAMTKHHVFAKVMQKESDLMAVVSELDELEKNQGIEFIHRSVNEDNVVAYKNVKNKKISSVFNEFCLIVIHNKKAESGIIVFAIYPLLDILCEDGYEYGFYYNMQDKPIYIENGEECSSEFEKSELWRHVHYKTEKITDNWWYYEEQYKVNAVKR